eukprot:scaffold118494_cov23-Attheya_sp.AAC.1
MDECCAPFSPTVSQIHWILSRYQITSNLYDNESTIFPIPSSHAALIIFQRTDKDPHPRIRIQDDQLRGPSNRQRQKIPPQVNGCRRYHMERIGSLAPLLVVRQELFADILVS